MFPLGESTKEQVRAEAAERGLGVADKPDSTDICFIPSGDTAGWLRGSSVEPRTGGRCGERRSRRRSRRGLRLHVGQRKGLALSVPAADGRPRYVLGVDPVSSRSRSVPPSASTSAGCRRAPRPTQARKRAASPRYAPTASRWPPPHAEMAHTCAWVRTSRFVPSPVVRPSCSTRLTPGAIAYSAAAGSPTPGPAEPGLRAASGAYGLAVADRVYPPVIGVAKGWFKALDLKLTVEGGEHVPREGGCVLVSTHVSYLDFIFVGLAADPSKRLVRFMAKKAVFDHKISGPLMRGMHHIPVDRKAGAGATTPPSKRYGPVRSSGCSRKRRSASPFEVKELKTGRRTDGARGRCADRPGDHLGHPAALDQEPAAPPLASPHPGADQGGSPHRSRLGRFTGRRHQPDQ